MQTQTQEGQAGGRHSDGGFLEFGIRRTHGEAAGPSAPPLLLSQDRRLDFTVCLRGKWNGKKKKKTKTDQIEKERTASFCQQKKTNTSINYQLLSFTEEPFYAFISYQ